MPGSTPQFPVLSINIPNHVDQVDLNEISDLTNDCDNLGSELRNESARNLIVSDICQYYNENNCSPEIKTIIEAWTNQDAIDALKGMKGLYNQNLNDVIQQNQQEWDTLRAQIDLNALEVGSLQDQIRFAKSLTVQAVAQLMQASAEPAHVVLDKLWNVYKCDKNIQKYLKERLQEHEEELNSQHYFLRLLEDSMKRTVDLFVLQTHLNTALSHHHLAFTSVLSERPIIETYVQQVDEVDFSHMQPVHEEKYHSDDLEETTSSSEENEEQKVDDQSSENETPEESKSVTPITRPPTPVPARSNVNTLSYAFNFWRNKALKRRSERAQEEDVPPLSPIPLIRSS